MNRGRGRQIIPGQKIHRSVQKRLIYNQTLEEGDKNKYTGPAALPSLGMPSWAEIAMGKGDEDDLWEA